MVVPVLFNIMTELIAHATVRIRDLGAHQNRSYIQIPIQICVHVHLEYSLIHPDITKSLFQVTFTQGNHNDGS